MDSSLISMESLSRNFQLMIQKCRAYRMSEVFLSRIAYNTIKSPLLEKMFALLQSLCTNEGVNFIDNCNIWGWDILYKDGLSLLNNGKNILVNNFNFLLKLHSCELKNNDKWPLTCFKSILKTSDSNYL